MKVLSLLGNRIQVRPLPQDEKASGSIFYAPQHKPEQQIHEVIAVGSGRRLKNGTIVEMPVKAGDHVLLDQYSLQSRTDAGEGTWIVDLDSCSLVIEL